MPSKIHDAIGRQWELLKFLPSHGAGKSSRELVQLLQDSGFIVTKRTVERDLNELLRLFPIECNDKSMPYGWRWMRDACIDLPGLTLAEALSTRLLENYLKPLLPTSLHRLLQPRFQLAASKLEALNDNPLNSWTKKVEVVLPGINLMPPVINNKVLETSQEALLHDEQLSITYHAIGNDDAHPLTVHPLGMVQRGPVTYLVATAFEYDDVRIYAMHRIQSAVRTGTAVLKPDDFNLEKFIKTGAFGFSDGSFIKLKASVSEYLAKILQETPLSEDMQITIKNGQYRLSCTVADSGQLLWWILSMGDNIEVVAPKKLRNSVVDSLKSTIEIYKVSLLSHK